MDLLPLVLRVQSDLPPTRATRASLLDAETVLEVDEPPVADAADW